MVRSEVIRVFGEVVEELAAHGGARRRAVAAVRKEEATERPKKSGLRSSAKLRQKSPKKKGTMKANHSHQYGSNCQQCNKWKPHRWMKNGKCHKCRK